jgi:hypothetical protein
LRNEAILVATYGREVAASLKLALDTVGIGLAKNTIGIIGFGQSQRMVSKRQVSKGGLKTAPATP